jgi:hypothetical protein
LEDPGVDGRIILKWMLKKRGGAQSESIWLRTGTGGGLLWIGWWNFGFHKMWEMSWVAEELLVSQEGLWYNELVIKSQFTTNAENIFYLSQCTHGHMWPRVPWHASKTRLWSATLY